MFDRFDASYAYTYILFLYFIFPCFYLTWTLIYINIDSRTKITQICSISFRFLALTLASASSPFFLLLLPQGSKVHGSGGERDCMSLTREQGQQRPRSFVSYIFSQEINKLIVFNIFDSNNLRTLTSPLLQNKTSVIDKYDRSRNVHKKGAIPMGIGIDMGIGYQPKYGT